MKIKIIVTDNDDNVLCKREALSFESAGENLGKLERSVEEMFEDEVYQERLMDAQDILEEMKKNSDDPDVDIGDMPHDCKLTEKGFCDCSNPI